MNIKQILTAFCLFTVACSLQSCRSSSDQIVENTRTSGRHFKRGVRSLGGKHSDSRAVSNRDEFYPVQNSYAAAQNPDFIPFSDSNSNDEVAMADFVTQQPYETPGDPGSSIPGIDSFRDPSSVPGLSHVFNTITFEYNSNLVKGSDNLNTVKNIGNYMKSHPNTYVFVEGHCDERGPEAYNLSLGSRRSNAVRNLLIQEGVNADNVFTISYGKENPLNREHHEDAWSQNRRAEFKVYIR